jgi:spore coat protein U-like protein
MCFYVNNVSSPLIPAGWYPLTRSSSVLATQLRRVSTNAIWGGSLPVTQTVTIPKNGSRSGNISIRAALATGSISPNIGIHTLAFSPAQSNMAFLVNPGNTPPATCGTNLTTNTFSFTMQANIIASCIVSNSNDLEFGTISTFQSDLIIDSENDVSLQCTKDIPYSVKLQSSNLVGNQFTMRNPSSTTPIAYNTYKDAARSQPWTSLSFVTGTGTGDSQTYTIYGRAYRPATHIAAGAYTDTNIMTITY